MKNKILTLAFASAVAFSFAFNNSKKENKEVKIDLIECERATLSCGKSGVACADTKEEVKEIIKKAEAHFCD
ncbi:hypothetical protein BTO06_17405 [Tenacibaculum sp. SZ-18]|uniref:hypothetical protein n=1 Tax=Tenacibaculum sp. SZ-18 TaxID=754423 RepID=UPI000C2D0160|nr:hypothetical protein [Tenacibaculum sp. SZ-18]AUC16810.1 hypothetical protein BTO06_17405 [Tenacibaculum sp. SZ-18]